MGLVADPEHLNLWSGLLHNTTCHLSSRLIANVFGLNGNDSHENPFASTHGEKPLPCHRSACASVLAPNSRPGTVSRELRRPACRSRAGTISPRCQLHHFAGHACPIRARSKKHRHRHPHDHLRVPHTPASRPALFPARHRQRLAPREVFRQPHLRHPRRQWQNSIQLLRNRRQRRRHLQHLPSRVSTQLRQHHVRLGTNILLNTICNVAKEFWPDLRRKIHNRWHPE